MLAGLSLAGFGLLNGSPYLPAAFQDGPPERSTLVLTALLGAALALLPMGLGVWALRRLPDGSPSRTTAGAAVLVAGGLPGAPAGHRRAHRSGRQRAVRAVLTPVDDVARQHLRDAHPGGTPPR